jgi:hypothetical protein
MLHALPKAGPSLEMSGTLDDAAAALAYGSAMKPSLFSGISLAGTSAARGRWWRGFRMRSGAPTGIVLFQVLFPSQVDYSRPPVAVAGARAAPSDAG